MEKIRFTKTEFEKILKEKGLDIEELSFNEILNNFFLRTKNASRRFGCDIGVPYKEQGFKIEDHKSIAINYKYAENVINTIVDKIKTIKNKKQKILNKIDKLENIHFAFGNFRYREENKKENKEEGC